MERKLRSITLHKNSGGLTARILYENFEGDQFLGSDLIWANPDNINSIINDENVKTICNKFWELYS